MDNRMMQNVLTLKSLFDLCSTQAKVALMSYLQYRAGTFISVGARLVEPIIYVVVWSSVADTQGGSINGFTRSTFAAYYIAIMIVNQLTFCKVMLKYEMRIQNGTLSQFLMRPASLVLWDAVDNLTMRAFIAVPVLLSAGVMAALFQPDFQFSLLTLLFAFALFTGWLTNFFIDYLFGMSAFWMTSTSSVDRILYMALFFFSGRLAPLDLLPPVFQTAAAVLPFRWILAFPTELLMGKLSFAQIVQGFAMQAFWILVGYGLLKVLWRAAVNRYSAVGG
jgi:ABC-2 type transport system permease protein